MNVFKILVNSIGIVMVVSLIVSCSISKKIEQPLGNPFPIIEVAPTSTSLSIYGCGSIVTEGDTMNVHQLMCSDSVRFAQLFSAIEVYPICIESQIEGTTWYSVAIDSTGKFENLEVKKEVDRCFNSTTAQIEEILRKTSVIEKEYFDTELLFYHEFRIEKN